MNRVYNLAYPNRVSFGYNFAGALVLPLMGFWNSIIYLVISHETLKEIFHGHIYRSSWLYWKLFGDKADTTDHTRKASELSGQSGATNTGSRSTAKRSVEDLDLRQALGEV